jgi:hypothetical protein
MTRTTACSALSLLLITCMLPLLAQTNPGTGSIVPRLVNYSGKFSTQTRNRCRESPASPSPSTKINMKVRRSGWKLRT